MTKAVGWSNWLCPPATKYHTDRNNIVTVAGMTGTSKNESHPVILEGMLDSDLYISNPNNIADMHIVMINRFFTKQMKLIRLPLLHPGTVFLTLNTNIVVQIISNTENAISIGAYPKQCLPEQSCIPADKNEYTENHVTAGAVMFAK